MSDELPCCDIAMRPIFIVGPPRSGTSWVQRLLLSDPRVCGGQETHFFNVFSNVLHSFHKHEKLGRNVGLPSYWAERELEGEILALWQKTIMPVIHGCPGARYLIEKTPDHATVLPEILQLLPHARVILVVRDSRSVVASLLAAGQGWGAGWAPKSARDASVLWYRYMKQALATGKAMPADRYLMVWYEDLMRNGLQETRRLFKFVGIEKSDQSLAEIISRHEFSLQKNDSSPIPVVRGSANEPKEFFRKGKVDSWREDLSFIQKLTVWRYTRKLMREMGYGWNGRNVKKP
jgi:hypothetical protein